MQAKLVICIVFLSAQSMAVLLGGTRIHQLAVTNQPQVNQTCTMEYILARLVDIVESHLAKYTGKDIFHGTGLN